MPADKSRLSRPDLKHLLTAGALVAGTVGTLLLGAALQVEPHAAEAVAGVAAPPLPATPPAGGTVAIPDEPQERIPEPAAPRPDPAPPRAASIAAPVLDGGGWTLQFMVTCNAETAANLQDRLGGDPRLLLLPVNLQGRACKRICWGDYPTRERAETAADVPDALLSIKADPMPRPLADVGR